MKAGEEKFQYNGVGMIGSPVCGDVMKFWILVDPKTRKNQIPAGTFLAALPPLLPLRFIRDDFLRNGGMTLEKARKITPNDIIKELGGLPDIKYHCSVLGDKALH